MARRGVISRPEACGSRTRYLREIDENDLLCSRPLGHLGGAAGAREEGVADMRDPEERSDAFRAGDQIVVNVRARRPAHTARSSSVFPARRRP